MPQADPSYIGERTGLLDKQTGQSLFIVKAVDISDLCEGKLAFLTYTFCSVNGPVVTIRLCVPTRYSGPGYSLPVRKIKSDGEFHLEFVKRAEFLAMSPEKLHELILEHAPEELKVAS